MASTPSAQARPRVLFYEVIPHEPHLETALELCQIHLDAGDRILFAQVAPDLPFVEGCRFPIRAADRSMMRAIHRRAAGLLAGSLSFVEGMPQEVLAAAASDPIPSFGTLAELMRYRWREYDIGMGVASSLISLSRDAEFEPATARSLVSAAIVSARATALDIERLAAEYRPDKIYVFNGRWGTVRPIVRYAQRAGIELGVHERGANRNKYFVYREMPHRFAYLQQEMRRHWERAPAAAAREELAARFFRDRRAGVEQSWFSFIDRQRSGQLPQGWTADRRNIVYFGSSDDEYVAITDHADSLLFADQANAIRALIDVVAGIPGAHLTIRVHPHIRRKHRKERRRWARLAVPGVTVVPADSPVSTYALMDRADVVVTFGSTAGVEAAYAGKPVICLGRAYYSELDVAYFPQSLAELESLLQDRALPARPRSGAVLFGYFFQNFGTEFRHYRPMTLFRGTFKGLELRRVRLSEVPLRAVIFFWRWLDRIRRWLGELRPARA